MPQYILSISVTIGPSNFFYLSNLCINTFAIEYHHVGPGAYITMKSINQDRSDVEGNGM